MRALPIFLVFVFCATSATAQSSVDPYKFIDKKDLHNADVNQLWRTLGISGKIRETTASGSKDTSESFNCGPDDYCEAKLASLDWPLLSGGGYDSVVRISRHDGDDLRRFLVFHREEEGGTWRLLDYLDSKEWDYDPPKVSVVFSGGKRWLVVTSLWHWLQSDTHGLVRIEERQTQDGPHRAFIRP